MLRIDFYESGIGETTIITFPDNGIAVIDAYPSKMGSRPDISALIADKTIHFICLTHPHSDHAKDLATITKKTDSGKVPILWHTVSDIHKWSYLSTESTRYPAGPFGNMIQNIRKKEAISVIELFANIATNKIPSHRLRSDLERKNIAGVEVFCLSPTEKQQQDFLNFSYEFSQGQRSDLPDKNSISAIIAFRYGKVVFVHGGDALKTDWFNAVEKYITLQIPGAVILKIPHHGSGNAYIKNTGKHRHNYMDICDFNKEIKSILFAGRSNQPNSNVYQELRKKTRVFCTANGLRNKLLDPLDLTFSIPESKYIDDSSICNPVISFECDDKGNVNIINGHDCNNCN